MMKSADGEIFSSYNSPKPPVTSWS